MTQEEALKILKNGHNVFLTGAAGSGKTYVLNQFIQYLKANKIHAGITASTGIAATHIDGMTIHAWAGIGLHRTLPDRDIVEITKQNWIIKRIQKTQTLIIDEVSMLDAARFDLLEKVTRVARGNFEPCGGMQVVLCGDLFQLPPVARADEPPPEPVYKSSAWEKLNLRVCYLHEQHRQGDPEFLRILNAIRDAAVDRTVVDRLRQCRNPIIGLNPSSRYVKLSTHNENVDWENRRELARLPGEEHRFFMNTSGVPALSESLKKSCLAPENLVLKKDAVVIFVKNNFEKGYVNGSLGKIKGFNENGIPVVALLNNKQIVAEPASKQEETLKSYSLEEIRKKHPAAYTKWTTDEEARLVASYQSGKSITMLSEMLGRKEGGIRSRLIRLGLIQNK